MPQPTPSALTPKPINAPSLDLVPGALREELTGIIDDTQAYLSLQVADSTRRAYTGDWTVFQRFCDEFQLPSLPAAPSTVALFLAREARAGRKVSTLDRRAASIRLAHRTEGLDPPTDDELVKAVLRGIRRKHRSQPGKKAPVLADQLLAMVALADPGTLTGARDRALLLLGFGAALRRSELVGLQVENLEFVQKGLRVHILQSKTDQEGRGQVVPVTRGTDACPVAAVAHWLALAGIEEGPVFRRVFKDARVAGKALSAYSVAVIVKRYAERLGLDPASFAGHSLRSGFLTSAARNHASLHKMMEVSRHKEPKTVMGYIRDAEEFDDHAGDGLL